MVAYSFQRQFVSPIEVGTKVHTLRAAGRRRHARVGEELQLYAGMRTKQCRLIARKTCTQVLGAHLRFGHRQLVRLWPSSPLSHRPLRDGDIIEIKDLDAFAVSDGFDDFDGLARFWRDTHKMTVATPFLIGWGPLYQ